MKAKEYEVRIENHYVRSVAKRVFTDSVVSAKTKARDVFGFSGNDNSIKVKLIN